MKESITLENVCLIHIFSYRGREFCFTIEKISKPSASCFQETTTCVPFKAKNSSFEKFEFLSIFIDFLIFILLWFLNQDWFYYINILEYKFEIVWKLVLSYNDTRDIYTNNILKGSKL